MKKLELLCHIKEPHKGVLANILDRLVETHPDMQLSPLTGWPVGFRMNFKSRKGVVEADIGIIDGHFLVYWTRGECRKYNGGGGGGRIDLTNLESLVTRFKIEFLIEAVEDSLRNWFDDLEKFPKRRANGWWKKPEICVSGAD